MLAANAAADSTETGADAPAMAAVTDHGATPVSAAPGTNSTSAAVGLATPDAGISPQDAAQANAAPISAWAIATPSGQGAVAAAAATNAQALLTHAATAADKYSPNSDAAPSLSLNSSDAAAGAAQLLTNPPILSQATAAPVLNVAARVDSNEFGSGVATQVSFMVDRNLNSASLQVNPPSLGPIEVRIALQGGHAQVWMTSHSAVTRDALESSSSKLREMLGTQGFGQVSVDISQRSFQERSSQSQTYDALPPIERGAAVGAAAQSRSAGSIPRAASGLVDAYA
jgi:flagellar hook-length control protein FliK